jgi:hypothetical protein
MRARRERRCHLCRDRAQLQRGVVIAVAAFGAIVGDNACYWLSGELGCASVACLAATTVQKKGYRRLDLLTNGLTVHDRHGLPWRAPLWLRWSNLGRWR